MGRTSLTAASEDRGARLDSFLAGRIPELTRSAAARLIETGRVTVAGRTAGAAGPGANPGPAPGHPPGCGV